MDNEFPDPEDEFDLMHEDEYEILRELEESEKQKTTANNSTQPKKDNNTQLSKNVNNVITVPLIENKNEESQILSSIKNKNTYSKESSENTKKRSIDQISKDISTQFLDEAGFDDIHAFEFQEKKRPCWDKPQELIQFILDKRKSLHGDGTKVSENFIRKKQTNSISRKVPLTDFIAVTRTDGERFYIKKCGKKEYVPESYKPTSGFLLKSFRQLKDEAEEILVKSVEKASILPVEPVNNENLSCELWVDKYRPKRYLELLSDENVNRSLLYWLKLWDKIVFDRDSTVRARKPQVFSKFNKFKKQEENIPTHDSNGFPTQRIALLTGPPGLGKTTLAHVAARHAGYNIVELNASDDRGPEAFREALLASTQMKALIDKEKRPNCLVLDEIDGAPAASIDLLLKFIHGKLVPKGKTAKTNKENLGCRRPIICICNDLYTPSLRPLRAMALVISVPEISPSTLADRLAEIMRKEGLRVDSRILLQLAEKSACDVRACLGILQYTGGKADMLRSLAFGLKDMRKGLFESWKELLHVPMDRRGVFSNSERVLRVVKIAHQGESDRLAQGIFHNYPEICKEKIVPVYKSMQWFQFYDLINKLVMERQCWMLMPYTTSAFVAWHLHLAGTQTPKISYPTALYEVNQKLERNLTVLKITKKTSKFDILTLVSEILPYLPDLLTPRLRSINAQLYSQKEKLELERLVNLMLDFGLTFTQEKKPEGGYDYYLDPNVWDIGVFPDCKPRRPLPYAVKQIVIPELESARLQRAAIATGESVNRNGTPSAPASKINAAPTPAPSTSTSKANENVPNHLKQLNPVELKPAAEKKSRNFFEAFQLAGKEKLKVKLEKEKELGIVNTEDKSKADKAKAAKKVNDLFKSDVWYQYKEGYSNAVRRTLRMKDLL